MAMCSSYLFNSQQSNYCKTLNTVSYKVKILHKYLMVTRRKQDEIKIRYCKDITIKVLLEFSFVINILRIFGGLGYKCDF